MILSLSSRAITRRIHTNIFTWGKRNKWQEIKCEEKKLKMSLRIVRESFLWNHRERYTKRGMIMIMEEREFYIHRVTLCDLNSTRGKFTKHVL